MNVKKVMAIFLAMAAALLVFTVPVSAENNEADIAPHYDLCPDCGGSIVNRGINWNNSWFVTKQTACVHYTYGTDLTLEDEGLQIWKCSKCNQGTSYKVYRTKTECHGYNTRTAAGNLEEVACTHYSYGTDLIAEDGTKDCHGYNPNRR